MAIPSSFTFLFSFTSGLLLVTGPSFILTAKRTTSKKLVWLDSPSRLLIYNKYVFLKRTISRYLAIDIIIIMIINNHLKLLPPKLNWSHWSQYPLLCTVKKPTQKDPNVSRLYASRYITKRTVNIPRQMIMCYVL